MRSARLTHEKFSSNHAEWARRVERWNGERGVGFLAMDGATAFGIAGSLLDENNPSRAQLVSMWTAPTHRRPRIGRLLVDAVLDWARTRKVTPCS